MPNFSMSFFVLLRQVETSALNYWIVPIPCRIGKVLTPPAIVNFDLSVQEVEEPAVVDAWLNTWSEPGESGESEKSSS